MRAILLAATLFNGFGFIVCPPVNTGGGEPQGEAAADPLSLINLDYGSYVQQVANALEKDEEFKKKLHSANASDLETGAISKYLTYASEKTRAVLNDLKRTEVRRLQELHSKLLKSGADMSTSKVGVGHVDHANLHTFEIEDLRKLIKQTTDDLTKLDEKRRTEFKRHEMEKEIQYQEELKRVNETQRAELVQEHEQAEKRHSNHSKVHHPGSRDQLEEVWEDVDHMDSEFNPKTFFMMHDLNGDGFLNYEELEALFQKELDKVYDPNNPDDDPVEREVEMGNMREHVMKEIDTDRDGLVSIEEFLLSTKSKDFEEDKGWQTIDEQPAPYTDEELKEYEKAVREQEEIYRKQHAGRDSIERG